MTHPTDETIDAELQAEIEAEFAELTAEIDRINAMPETPGPEKVAMLQALREQWRQRERPDGEGDDRPAWRHAIDEAVTGAVDGLLDDGLHVDLDGNIQFDLQGESMKMHGQPVVDALLSGLKTTLSERFPAFDEAAQAGIDPGRMLMATLLGGLEQVVRGANTPTPSPTTAPEDEASPPPSEDAGPAPVKVNIDFSGLIGALLKPRTNTEPTPQPPEDPPDDP